MFHSVSLPGRGELERPVSCGGGCPMCVCAWEEAQSWGGPRQGWPSPSAEGGRGSRGRCGLRLRGQRSLDCAGAGARLSPRPGSPGTPALGRQPPARSVRGPSLLSGVGRGWGNRGGRRRLPGVPPTGTWSARGAGAAPAPSAPAGRARAAAPLAVMAPAPAAAESCGAGGARGRGDAEHLVLARPGTPRTAAERPTPGEARLPRLRRGSAIQRGGSWGAA